MQPYGLWQGLIGGAIFPDAHIPKLSKLKTELEKARTDYAEQSAERKALKKEANRLPRERKVSLNKKRQGERSPCRGLV